MFLSPIKSAALSLSLNVVSFEQFEPIEGLNFVLYKNWHIEDLH